MKPAINKDVGLNKNLGQVDALIKASSDPFNVISISKSKILEDGLDIIFIDFLSEVPTSTSESIVIKTKVDYNDFNSAAISAIIGSPNGVS